jgi:hypothetical protein|tara:strand:- start:114 stop:317 length:204 start_codon:yes stop_codon:yes gene_type:complete
MQFRIGSIGGRVLAGCGALLVVSGLVLFTPLGTWLMQALAWITVFLGLFFAVMCLFLWRSMMRRRYF